jgi:uncharacterized membrane protein
MTLFDLSEDIINLAKVAFVSMLPIFELRGGIPLGIIGYGITWWKVFLVSVIANIVPIPFILKLMDPLEKWLRQWRTWDRVFSWLFAHTRKKTRKKIERWEELGLILFVAIPLPVTGAWTGSLAAYVFNLRFKKALACIFAGVLIAALVITCASVTGFNLFLGV